MQYLTNILNGDAENFSKFDTHSLGVISKIKQCLEQCQNFAVEDSGRILNAGWGQLTNDAKLPFPAISIEYFNPDKTQLNKHFILATQLPNELQIYSFFALSNNQWHLSPISGVLSINKNIKKSYLNGDISHKTLIPWMMKELDSEIIDMITALSTIDMSVVLELMEALICRNVYIETLEKGEHKKKNERRIKQGKIPLYETKILVVNPAYKEIDKTDLGGTHASPRQHLRRGHIRRYATYSVWINNTVVGKAENGIITKSYDVKGETK